MRSIGARLALWYAGAATLTMMGLSLAGYYLLENQLVRGLDLLNAAQFAQIRAHLGDDFAVLNPGVIDTRIRETSDFSSVLFFITVDDRSGPVRPVFYSTNLRGQPIPDVPGKRVFDAQLPGIGELRVGEFLLGPFDVTIATSLGSVRETMHDFGVICLWMLAVMIAISAAVGFGLSRLALGPVRLIRDTANHISSDNLGERIPVGSVKDEISELAQLLNQTFDRLESAFDQIRRFTAEASHELKTPLSLIRLQAEKLLLRGSLDASSEESVNMQLEEIARLSQIIEELLFLSRAEARDIDLHLVDHDPEVLLANFGQDARVLLEHRGLRYLQTHQGAGTVQVEPRWLRRVLLNLLANAISVSPAAGVITLNSTLRNGTWQVSVDDEGPGVPPELRERIFERFFRLGTAAEDSETGSGLGLAICRSIISLHSGRIWAESSVASGGLRVIFVLPAAPAASHAKA
jgi:signal transduction histidine kinase